jgi:succinate dehydrogenase/fumarate reductase cytochrome b subunit
LILLVLVLVVPISTNAEQVLPPTPLEEAVAKIIPATGVLYRQIEVTDETGKFVKNYFETGGTLTVFAANSTNSCAATVAHSVVNKDEVIKTEIKEVGQPDKTKKKVTYTHRFTGRYLASFDGEHYIDIALVAYRGGAGLNEDFAAFRVPVGNMPKVEFGSENMVKVGTEVFMVSAPIGIIGTATFGHVARDIKTNFPITGSDLPIVKRAYVIDIRMTRGSSGAFIYVLRGNTGYAFAMLVAFFAVGTADARGTLTSQVGSSFPNALGITSFKKFVEGEKVLGGCLQ